MLNLCSVGVAELWLCGRDRLGLRTLIAIYKENKKSQSYCRQNEKCFFDYRGVENALVQNPKKLFDGPTFTPKRIIVIQMI